MWPFCRFLFILCLLKNDFFFIFIKNKIQKLKKSFRVKNSWKIYAAAAVMFHINVFRKHWNIQQATLKARTCSVRIEELFELSDFLCALRLCREKIASFRHFAAYPKFIFEISVPFLMRTDVDLKIIASFLSCLEVWRW